MGRTSWTFHLVCSHLHDHKLLAHGVKGGFVEVVYDAENVSFTERGSVMLWKSHECRLCRNSLDHLLEKGERVEARLKEEEEGARTDGEGSAFER